jgi:hypothetical protein
MWGEFSGSPSRTLLRAEVAGFSRWLASTVSASLLPRPSQPSICPLAPAVLSPTSLGSQGLPMSTLAILSLNNLAGRVLKGNYSSCQ